MIDIIPINGNSDVLKTEQPSVEHEVSVFQVSKNSSKSVALNAKFKLIFNFFFQFRKIILSFLIVVLVIILLTKYLFQGNLALKSRASNNGPILSFIPSSDILALGQTSTYAISLSTNEDTVSAVQLEISYDDTAVDQISFTPGTVVPVVLHPLTIDNGKISITLGASFESPFKGSGVLGQLQIHTISEKSGTIEFTNNTKIASIGKTVNSLASTVALQIVVPASQELTPTPITEELPAIIPSVTPFITPTPKPTKPVSSKMSLRQCQNKCIAPTNLNDNLRLKYKASCFLVCDDIVNQNTPCTTACDKISNLSWAKHCKNTICK